MTFPAECHLFYNPFMLNRSIAPNAYPIELIKFPEVKTTRLANGLEIQSLSLGEQPVFKLEFSVPAGASLAEKAGIASLTSSLMKRGTSHRNATEIHQIFDYFGAFWDIQTNLDTATFVLYGLSKHLKSLLPYVIEIIQEANFPVDEFEKEIAIEVQKNKLNWQKTAFSASQLLRQELFSPDAYGRVSTQEKIEAIQHVDLIDFHSKHWLGAMPQIFLSGKIREAELEEVQKTFQGLPTHVAQKPKPFAPTEKPKAPIHEIRENAMQSSIRMGMISMTRHHPDYFKFSVLNTVLGGFFGSRLQKIFGKKKDLLMVFLPPLFPCNELVTG